MDRRQNYHANARAKFRKSFAEAVPEAIRLTDDEFTDALHQASEKYDLQFKYLGDDAESTAIADGKLLALQVVLPARTGTPQHVLDIWSAKVLPLWAKGLGPYGDSDLPPNPKELWASLMAQAEA